MEREVFIVMESSMGLLCTAATNSSGAIYLLGTMKVQLRAASGDELREDQDLDEYFRKSLLIPLAERTILSRPYKTLAFMLESSSTSAEELIRFRKEICRSATLLSLARNNQKLDQPEAGLEWMDDRWRTTGELRSFKWLVRNEIGLPLYYIPLSYFPGANSATAVSATKPVTAK